MAACEAVARLRAPAGEPLRMLEAGEDGQPPLFSRVALVGAPRVVLTGSQLAFGYEDEDARLAFQRLGKTLEQEGSSLGPCGRGFDLRALSRCHRRAGRQDRRRSFLTPAKPPAGTLVPVVGLPSLDASFAVDVLAVTSNSQ